jgi:hypothetical protein
VIVLIADDIPVMTVRIGGVGIVYMTILAECICGATVNVFTMA